MSDFVLQARGLGRDFGATAALNDVDLEIGPGLLVGLAGPNGAGKTTLLHLLAGLLEPTRGTCSVLGEPARRLSTVTAAKVVCVGDRNEPPRWYPVGDLLHLQNSASDHFDWQFARSLLAERELSESARWGSLSKGQRRWILATLALAARPRLLLMDEPADGLDPHARLSLYNHLRQFVNDHEATVVVSSHVLGDLQRVIDDLIMIQHGEVMIAESLDVLRDEVREVQSPATLDAIPNLDQFTILARHSDQQTDRLWLRSPESAALEELERHPELNCQTANLESLYLALTDPGEVQVKQQPIETEVATC